MRLCNAVQSPHVCQAGFKLLARSRGARGLHRDGVVFSARWRAVHAKKLCAVPVASRRPPYYDVAVAGAVGCMVETNMLGHASRGM